MSRRSFETLRRVNEIWEEEFEDEDFGLIYADDMAEDLKDK